MALAGRLSVRWARAWAASAPRPTALNITAATSAGTRRPRELDFTGILGHDMNADPFALGRPHLEELSASVRGAVSVMQNPVLDRAAGYFFSADISPGKRIRPVMVFLMAGATSGLRESLGSSILGSQRQLAEITEMIHTASLLHDDVIDAADTRRGVGSVNAVFGNQLAVLAGDFLLARASMGLARLRDCDVVETLSTVIEHLVRGEVLQLDVEGGAKDVESLFERYLRKTFYKTASLLANSCRATAMLAGHTDETCQLAFDYGNNMGMAFQLVDDALDLTSTSSALGKPAFADLRAGVATAPFLFALQAASIDGDAGLGDLLSRRFSRPGDVEHALEHIEACGGVRQTMELATEYADRAVRSVVDLPPSEYRSGLINLASTVLQRKR